MSQGQSSIKGRGTEILVGVPKAIQVSSAGSDSAPAQPPAHETESPLVLSGEGTPPPAQADQSPATLPEEPAPPTGAEMSAALYAEARDAESIPSEGQDHWIMESEWPPAPETELALFEEPVEVPGVPEAVAQPADLVEDDVEEEEVIPAQPSAPEVASSALPSTPLAAEENVAEEPVVPAEPAQPEDASGASPIPPPAAAAVEKASPPDAYDIQSPEELVAPLELPERVLTDEQKRELGETAPARIEKLDNEIDQLYEQVLKEVGENENIATDCFNLLLKARDILNRRDLLRLPQAEYYAGQVRARLKRAAVSTVGARRNAWWILAWGLLWGMIFVALLILLDSQWTQGAIDSLGLRSTFIDPRILLPAMVWGGIGAVVAIWYSLFKHVALRDFDRYYNISYLGKPFFGLVLGATVYMVIQLLVVSLGIGSASLSGLQTGGPTVAPWIIYLLAWASGFKENRIFGVVDQIMKRIFSISEPTSSTTSDSLS